MTRKIYGPGFYTRQPGGRFERIAGQDHAVDVWICRRVADYAPAPIPAEGARDTCTRCAAPIIYNPARRVAAPRVCMQCAGITPLPIAP